MASVNLLHLRIFKLAFLYGLKLWRPNRRGRFLIRNPGQPIPFRKGFRL